MSFTINSRSVAEIRIQNVALRPLLGAYELVFGLDVTIQPEREHPRKASIGRARVSVKTPRGKPAHLGLARPETDFYIETGEHGSHMTPDMVLPVSPAQIAAIEDLRGNNDLEFDLLATGTATTQYGPQQVQDTWKYHVPRSDWLKTLKNAGARDVLLLEVPLPLPNRSRKWASVTKSLQSAEEHFRNGDYQACVGSCRTAIQELGYQKFGKKDWANPLLDRLGKSRQEMTQNEREGGVVGRAAALYAPGTSRRQ